MNILILNGYYTNSVKTFQRSSNKGVSKINSSVFSNRNIISGFLFGLGLIAFIDEAIFHQMLGWHHFYDRATTSVGVFSDGIFHAVSWFATVAGLFLFADIKRRGTFQFKSWLGGLLFGAGLFNLYDGTIQHKVMRIHQIRYVDNLIYYDITMIVTASVLTIAGIILILLGRNVQVEKHA